MQIKFKKKFVKMLEKAPLNVQRNFEEKLKLFTVNPYNIILNNHNLKGQYQGLNSINITGDWRTIFKYEDRLNKAIFYLIGTHSQLYK